MNQYTTGMRNASKLANRIIQMKGNRFLDNIQALTIDDTAYLPDIHRWVQLQGFRTTDTMATGKLLQQFAHQWIRTSCRNGAPSLFVMTSDAHCTLSVCYSNTDTGGVLRAHLPDCQIFDHGSLNMGSFCCSGIVLGTLASDRMADTFASAGLRDAYMACVILPIADAMARDILAENQRLMAKLTPYKSFQRTYGNASRRTVEYSVQEVNEALLLLKEEGEFLRSQIPSGFVCAAVRFGANDRGTFLRLSNLIQSGMIAHGEHPGFEPVRCFELNGLFSTWSECVSIPGINVGQSGVPQHLAYALSFQSIADVASFCTAPTHAYSGYYIDCSRVEREAYDLFPQIRPIAGTGIAIGRTLNSTGAAVLPLDRLLCHTAVFGASNSGKTNVVMKILHDAWIDYHIPFVVLEAAKKEYHALLADIPELRIFTPGVDGVPLDINPLQPEDGVLIENHVSAVVGAISSSTGTEHPIPEAFAGLLKRTYERFGWMFGMTAYADRARPFPTFADVCEDVDGYISASAQYGPEVRQNLTAALKLRCETFASGALGRLFATASGLSAKDFFEAPAVIELSDIAEENAAFLMNVLLFRFQSFLERRPTSGSLQRLIVVEEAHNIFRRTRAEDTSLARSNQAFDKMFAEVRASGTGLILSDQRPSIMPDSVMANTAVKICLSMDSEEDRVTIGDAMGISERQHLELHTFGIGECIITIRGHRGAFHVKTDKLAAGTPFSAACPVCTCRFRCRKADVQRIVSNLPTELLRYHMAKITAEPYNTSTLSANIEDMLNDMHVMAAAPTRLCLLGELLRQANVPMQEGRFIVNSYKNYLKEVAS